MSAKLTKALEFANYRITLNNQHAILRARVQTLLSYSINGGTFTIDQTLISFCKALIDHGETKCVLLDIYNNPVEVVLHDFYDDILSRYFEATNEYHAEYTKLKKARKVSSVVDIHEKD